MFTGIITKVGRLGSKTPRGKIVELKIETGSWKPMPRVSDSVCVNGVCLTVVRAEKTALFFQAVPETLEATNLGRIEKGDLINLEASLRAGDPLGGHFVMGHVDGLGEIERISRRGDSLALQIKAPEAIIRQVVVKGSIAVEGISLTVQQVQRGSFKVAIIPFTLAHTNLKHKSKGDWVNLETDFFAKYIEKYRKPSRRPAGLSVKFLKDQGF